MAQEVIRKGSIVRLLKQSFSHTGTGGYDVKVGTIGEVKAFRKLGSDDGLQFLVKFRGSGGLRHTPAIDVELVR